jgi:transposase-like protein
MNIIERGRAFLQSLRELAGRTAWDWRRCPHCGQTLTSKWGSYTRHPWTLVGRQVVRVQRHRCEPCSATQGRHVTYSEESPWLVRGSWYAREVQRCALDHWLHLGVSVRRTAAVLRSWLGKQERWRLWRALEVSPPPDDATACHLSGSTVQRWLDRAGAHARQTLPAQLAGVPTSGQLGTDGLWARLRGDTTRVVLLLTDSVTGVVWPPVVALGEASPLGWGHLVRRARLAGLVVTHVHGIVSDGATGLEAYRRRALAWVSHQRCVFHLWRGLAGELAQQARAAAANLTGAAAKQVRTHTRRTLVALIHAVLDAPTWAAAEAALATLAAHERGAKLARYLETHLDAALVYQCGYNQGLLRVGPEWCWRDFRLRAGHGRNHASDRRLERAALVWAIYHNFEPAQRRCERKRQYRHAGQCPLAVAGVPPGSVCYLDALGV